MKPKFSGPIQSPARMPHSGRHFQRSDGSHELTRLGRAIVHLGQQIPNEAEIAKRLTCAAHAFMLRACHA